MAEKCGEYFERFRRQTFVTPKSYLSFIDIYKIIYTEKIAHVGTLAERMKTGTVHMTTLVSQVNMDEKNMLRQPLLKDHFS